MAKRSEELVYYRWTEKLETQTHNTILDFPSKDSDRNLVNLQSLYGTWVLDKLNF